MNQLLLVIILALLKLISAPVPACSVYQSGAITCDINCDYCINGNCYSCCPSYYLSTGDICYSCGDSNCLYCTSTQCLTCISGYAPLTSNIKLCKPFSSLTAINCQSANGCTTSTCVNQFSYGLNNASECVACYQLYAHCDTCNNIRCLSCQSNYYLNDTANYKQCGLCKIPFCSYCSSTTSYCSSCEYGYYRSSGLCLPCKYPCLACSSLITCSVCDTSFQLYTRISSKCVLCNITNIGCLTCTLSTNFTCLTCYTRYYLLNNSCNICASQCLTCQSAPSQCLSCINSTYVYNPSTYACFLCKDLYSYCKNCTPTACTVCDTGYTINGGSCVACSALYLNCNTCDTKCLTCLAGFQLLSNFTCSSTLCDSPCSICGASQTSCLNCITAHYLSGSSCLPCIAPCKTCQSSTYCLTCYEQMQYSNGVCTACTSTQRYNPFTLLCEACPANCLSCSWWQGCLNCTSSLFVLSMNKCVDICGDSYVADFQCDTTIGVGNDGCTDTCNVQPNYSCTKILNTTLINNVSTTVNVSQCSYIGTVSTSLVSAVQSIFKNNLKLGFSIKPYNFGMPTNADPQTYLKTIFNLSPLDSLASYQISIDQKSGIVYFSIDHISDISSINPILTINYNYLASVNTMFQYMASVTYNLPQLNQILPVGRLGEPQEQDTLSLSKTIYYWSSFIACASIFIMLFGIFGKQLVGLDQVIACQHVFLLILFYKGKLTFPLMSLSGLKYSTGLHFQDDLITMNDSQSYILQLDSSSFLNNFNLNLAVYTVPLAVSFVILLYKLRYKHLAAYRDLAQQAYEVIMGQTILYLVMFNLSGLIAYSYLYYTYSPQPIKYYDSVAVSIAVFVTIFGIFNFFSKPQIVGMFRSSFKTQSEERDTRRSKIIQNFSSCISKRCFQQKLKNHYSKITINFYLIYMIYFLLFMLITVFTSFESSIIILGLQLIMFVLIIIVRPHFNPFEKLRSLLTWLIMIIGTATVVMKPKTFTLPILFLILFTLHLIISIVIIILSFWSQIKRKCNDRTEVVKSLMKEGLAQNEKDALRELIERYQRLQRKNSSMNEQVEKIQINFHENFKQKYQKLQIFQNEPKKQQPDQQKAQFEQQIIKEQHQHFRYQKGLQFFNKYANTIDLDLIKEYPDIDDN